jgi:hypothetical protein
MYEKGFKMKPDMLYFQNFNIDTLHFLDSKGYIFTLNMTMSILNLLKNEKSVEFFTF